ncbi:hypothetical protein HF086_017072 [Spodoptera exigua]|uniref:Uncharacterized protein n=1 Tax=Spodoptera exigua TaxID=7107 RepID=A0A922SH14_SPOEX|nr:hypothetical protein HF086_017072 [Spodoptera exigua]
MCDSPDIRFSQYAQGFPTPSLSWHTPEPQPRASKTPKVRRQKRNQTPTYQSFVLNNEKKKGVRLIQVQVLDINEQQEPATPDGEVVVMSAQYVVTEPVDYVMDETQALINKISKKLCEDHSYN